MLHPLSHFENPKFCLGIHPDLQVANYIFSSLKYTLVHLFPLTLISSCRNLVALSRQLARQRATDDNASLTGRHCLILCVLLLSQLLLNYVFT